MTARDRRRLARSPRGDAMAMSARLVVVTSVSASDCTVTMRGREVEGVRWVGDPPQPGDTGVASRHGRDLVFLGSLTPRRQDLVSGSYTGDGAASRDIALVDDAGEPFEPATVTVTADQITGTTTYGIHAAITGTGANFALYWGPTSSGGVSQHGQISNDLRLLAAGFRVSANLMNRNGIGYRYVAWPVAPGGTQL